mmetsp:Transcript_8381/g.14898  ORF Transcript_8381/g.14898 Transcript_8381/m.14898 type:complete len:466 (+) Transcript_8381:181-1578(+)|eukprot:CAMPEP_0197656644 /NCGR_PEP_ID=MMETSP1338-20131121/42693_1 /TAXON_ID=43686 ORGANISM="Pelagodinium beii, Strain RCC1491" /NCGR_SAMPLE_ID=MMETSP1338 /ASSEMBLY_ACC=CAM_ASM_000754 /LENGTH=465 /DNA_ID=CAMNT_0043232731 /DNA_START=181 /DNA_END=1578 /DNA_ORIENTATION=+
MNHPFERQVTDANCHTQVLPSKSARRRARLRRTAAIQAVRATDAVRKLLQNAEAGFSFSKDAPAFHPASAMQTSVAADRLCSLLSLAPVELPMHDLGDNMMCWAKSDSERGAAFGFIGEDGDGNSDSPGECELDRQEMQADASIAMAETLGAADMPWKDASDSCESVTPDMQDVGGTPAAQEDLAGDFPLTSGLHQWQLHTSSDSADDLCREQLGLLTPESQETWETGMQPVLSNDIVDMLGNAEQQVGLDGQLDGDGDFSTEWDALNIEQQSEHLPVEQSENFPARAGELNKCLSTSVGGAPKRQFVGDSSGGAFLASKELQELRCVSRQHCQLVRSWMPHGGGRVAQVSSCRGVSGVAAMDQPMVTFVCCSLCDLPPGEVGEVVEIDGLPLCQSCSEHMGLQPNMTLQSQEPVVQRITELLAAHPGMGYRAVHAQLKRDDDFRSVPLKRVQSLLHELKGKMGI